MAQLAKIVSKRANPEERKGVEWDESLTCVLCSSLFNTFRRAHHCRRCGKSFCGKCSDYFAFVPEHGFTEKAVRVCMTCFKHLNPENGVDSEHDRTERLEVPQINAAVDDQGRTPLMLAAIKGNLAMVRHLVCNMGADVNVKCASGQTARDYALAGNFSEVATFLEEPQKRASVGGPEAPAPFTADIMEIVGPKEASLDTLISRLTSVAAGVAEHSEYCQAFLLNYPQFLNVNDLILKLEAEFDLEVSRFGDDKRLFVLSKLKVVSVIHSLATTYPEDIREITSEKANQFLNRIGNPDLNRKLLEVPNKGTLEKELSLPSSPSKPSGDLGHDPKEDTQTWFKRAQARLHHEQRQLQSEIKAARLEPVMAIPMRSIFSDPGPEDASGFSAQLLAEQMTKIDGDLFQQVALREFINQDWSKKNRKPSVVAEMVDVFNKRSFWVASEILCGPDPSARARQLTKYVTVCQLCASMNNFYGAYAVLTGLTFSSVLRLKATFDKAAPKTLRTLEQLRKDMDAAHNFAAYRQHFQEAEQKDVPRIPQLVVVLNDLYQLSLMNTTGSQPDLINFYKFSKQWRIQRTILRCKAFKYPFEHDPACVRFLHARNASRQKDEEELWALSFKYEPKSELHTLSLLWKTLDLRQKCELQLEQTEKVESVASPIRDARRAREEKEKALRAQEDELIRVESDKLQAISNWLRDEAAAEDRLKLKLRLTEERQKAEQAKPADKAEANKS